MFSRFYVVVFCCLICCVCLFVLFTVVVSVSCFARPRFARSRLGAAPYMFLRVVLFGFVCLYIFLYCFLGGLCLWFALGGIVLLSLLCFVCGSSFVYV